MTRLKNRRQSFPPTHAHASHVIKYIYIAPIWTLICSVFEGEEPQASHVPIFVECTKSSYILTEVACGFFLWFYQIRLEQYHSSFSLYHFRVVRYVFFSWSSLHEFIFFSKFKFILLELFDIYIQGQDFVIVSLMISFADFECLCIGKWFLIRHC